jgi:uncharacterized protein
MILKLLLVIGVIAIIYFMFIKQKPLKQTSSKQSQKKAKKEVQVDDMVECETCGVYVALDESILSNGHYYCSDECVAKAS